MDITFESTREHEFLQVYFDAAFQIIIARLYCSLTDRDISQDIVECVENDEVDLFTQKVYAYDEKTKLDNWKTSILLKIKKGMAEEPSLM